MFCDLVFFVKQKTAYEMRISEWSSDVCSSDLLIVVELRAGAVSGFGYSYTQAVPAAALVRDKLRDIVVGANPYDLPQLWQQMNAALRNLGRPGLGLMAIAAVDIALWDIKARLQIGRASGRERGCENGKTP